jgi:hypothetical protein
MVSSKWSSINTHILQIIRGNETNTIQIQTYERLRCEIAMSKKEGCKRMARRTDEGTSARAASKNQMRPLRTENYIREFGSITDSENCQHRTCFHRKAPKAKLPPALRRMRSKPTSIMIHSAASVTSVAIILGAVLSKLVKTQVFAAGNHAERICGCRISRAGPK